MNRSNSELKIDYFTKEQLEIFLSLSIRLSEKKYMIIYTLANTGLRASELVQLVPNAVKFSTKQLHIIGKGKRFRSVDISNELSMLLYQYVKKNGIKTNKPIFPVTRQRIYQIVNEITYKNPHLFRHTYAILLLKKTKNIKYVQKQLGHSSLATTEQYLQYMDFETEKTLLGELLL